MAKPVPTKTALNDSYVNPDRVIWIETVGPGCRITMSDGRDFIAPDDKHSVAVLEETFF